MNEPISLRPAEQSDRELLCRVYASTREEELARVDWDDATKEKFLRMQFEAQHKHYTENYPGADFTVILCGDEPCGRLYTVRWECEIRIMDIAILPEFRNRGIGTRLLRGIIAMGDALNLPVSIHVEKFNPALKLYQRLGFECVEDKGVHLLLSRQPRRDRGILED